MADELTSFMNSILSPKVVHDLHNAIDVEHSRIIACDTTAFDELPADIRETVSTCTSLLLLDLALFFH